MIGYNYIFSQRNTSSKWTRNLMYVPGCPRVGEQRGREYAGQMTQQCSNRIAHGSHTGRTRIAPRCVISVLLCQSTD